MGEPGSKIILTVLTKTVRKLASPEMMTPEQLEKDTFQSAGDDQIIVG